MKTNERICGAGLALLACAMAVGASVLLAKPRQGTPAETAAVRGEAVVCLVDDDALPPLI